MKRDLDRYMRKRRVQNLITAKDSDAENWAFGHLNKTKFSFTRQKVWGFRIFDFWNGELGIAVEIDGPEHDAAIDWGNDKKNWEQDRIIVIRIKNFDQKQMNGALQTIEYTDSWDSRRVSAGKISFLNATEEELNGMSPEYLENWASVKLSLSKVNTRSEKVYYDKVINMVARSDIKTRPWVVDGIGKNKPRGRAVIK